MPFDDPNKESKLKAGKPPKSENFENPDDVIDYDKMKVRCLCPKCGQTHVMNFHWIGRGTPRKFCPLCKGSIS